MLSRFAACILLVLLAQCIALSPSHGNDSAVPYSDRPDVRKLEARTLNPKASLAHWPRSKTAFRLFLAELLALYPKEEIYLLARDGEYLYDLAQTILEGHPEILSRIHLLNVSRGSQGSSHLKEYLEQEGLVAEKISGKGVVFVDTGYAGSIPMAITGALPKELSPQLKSHMIASSNDSIPSSRLFVEAHYGKEISYNPPSNGNGVDTIENLPHYTNSAVDYKQVQVKGSEQTRWEPVARPAPDDVQESAVQLIADLKAYGETPEIRRQFFEEIKVMRQLSDAASGRSTELDTEEKLTEALLKLKEKNLSAFMGDLLECHVRGNHRTNEASMRFWSTAAKIVPPRLGYPISNTSVLFRDFKAEELLSFYSHSIMTYIGKSSFMATLNKKLDSDADALSQFLAWLEKEYDPGTPGRSQGKKKSADEPLNRGPGRAFPVQFVFEQIIPKLDPAKNKNVDVLIRYVSSQAILSEPSSLATQDWINGAVALELRGYDVIPELLHQLLSHRRYDQVSHLLHAIGPVQMKTQRLEAPVLATINAMLSLPNRQGFLPALNAMKSKTWPWPDRAFELVVRSYLGKQGAFPVNSSEEEQIGVIDLIHQVLPNFVGPERVNDVKLAIRVAQNPGFSKVTSSRLLILAIAEAVAKDPVFHEENIFRALNGENSVLAEAVLFKVIESAVSSQFKNFTHLAKLLSHLVLTKPIGSKDLDQAMGAVFRFGSQAVGMIGPLLEGMNKKGQYERLERFVEKGVALASSDPVVANNFKKGVTGWVDAVLKKPGRPQLEAALRILSAIGKSRGGAKNAAELLLRHFVTDKDALSADLPAKVASEVARVLAGVLPNLSEGLLVRMTTVALRAADNPALSDVLAEPIHQAIRTDRSSQEDNLLRAINSKSPVIVRKAVTYLTTYGNAAKINDRARMAKHIARRLLAEEHPDVARDWVWAIFSLETTRGEFSNAILSEAAKRGRIAAFRALMLKMLGTSKVFHQILADGCLVLLKAVKPNQIDAVLSIMAQHPDAALAERATNQSLDLLLEKQAGVGTSLEARQAVYEVWYNGVRKMSSEKREAQTLRLLKESPDEGIRLRLIRDLCSEKQPPKALSDWIDSGELPKSLSLTPEQASEMLDDILFRSGLKSSGAIDVMPFVLTKVSPAEQDKVLIKWADYWFNSNSSPTGRLEASASDGTKKRFLQLFGQGLSSKNDDVAGRFAKALNQSEPPYPVTLAKDAQKKKWRKAWLADHRRLGQFLSAGGFADYFQKYDSSLVPVGTLNHIRDGFLSAKDRLRFDEQMVESILKAISPRRSLYSAKAYRAIRAINSLNLRDPRLVESLLHLAQSAELPVVRDFLYSLHDTKRLALEVVAKFDADGRGLAKKLASPPFFEGFISENDRVEALKAHSHFRDPKAQEFVIRNLTNRYPVTRNEAVSAIALIKPEDLTPENRKLLIKQSRAYMALRYNETESWGRHLRELVTRFNIDYEKEIQPAGKSAYLHGVALLRKHLNAVIAISAVAGGVAVADSVFHFISEAPEEKIPIPDPRSQAQIASDEAAAEDRLQALSDPEDFIAEQRKRFTQYERFRKDQESLREENYGLWRKREDEFQMRSDEFRRRRYLSVDGPGGSVVREGVRRGVHKNYGDRLFNREAPDVFKYGVLPPMEHFLPGGGER